MVEFSMGLAAGLVLPWLYRRLAARWDKPPADRKSAPPFGDAQQRIVHENHNFLHYDGETQEAYHGTRD